MVQTCGRLSKLDAQHDTENRNLDLIRDAEASKHETGPTGRHALLAYAYVDGAEAGDPQRRRVARAARRWRRSTASVSASHGCSSTLTSATGTNPPTSTIRNQLSANRTEKLANHRGGAEESAQAGTGARRYGTVRGQVDLGPDAPRLEPERAALAAKRDLRAARPPVSGGLALAVLFQPAVVPAE